MAQLGRYTLVRRVGVGGMAEVWKAKAQGPGGFEKVVAVKRILPHLVADMEFIDMFVEEAKIVARLAHPNIVQVFDFGLSGADEEDRSNYYIAMEYVAGQNLAEILKREEEDVRLDEDVALYICKDTAKGLAYASSERGPDGNAMNIIHRDISPHNIMVSYRGEVKITDFGIAKVTSALPRTAAGVWKGKIAYMSPEQATLQPLDHRSDLFSLGIVLYELVKGARLFPGRTSEEIYSRITNFSTPSDGDLAELQPSTRTILQRALQIDREDRFESGQEMADAILEALGTSGVVGARKKIRAMMTRLFPSEQEREVKDHDVITGTELDDSGPERAKRAFNEASTSISSGDQPEPNNTAQLHEERDHSGRTSEWMAAVENHEEGAQMRTTVEGAGEKQPAAQESGGTQIASTRVSTSPENPQSGDTLLFNRDSPMSRPADEVDQSIVQLKADIINDSSLPEPKRSQADTVRIDRARKTKPTRDAFRLELSPRMIVVGLVLIFAAIAAGILADRLIPQRGGGGGVVQISPTVTPTAAATPEPTTTEKIVVVTKVVTQTPKPTAKPTRRKTPVRTKTPAVVVTVSTPKPTTKPTTPGKLTVKARPWCEVWVGNKKITSETPLRVHELPAGKHKVTFINPDYDFKVTKTIQIRSGRELELFVNVPKGTVEIR